MQARADDIVSATKATATSKVGGRALPHAAAMGAAFLSALVILQASLDQPKEQPAPAQVTAITLDPAAVVGVLNSAFTPEGVRNKPRYPMEFEAILGPTTMQSFELFASASWPSQGAMMVAAAQPAAAHKSVVAQACPATGCRGRDVLKTRLAEAKPALPPARPALLLPVVVAEADAAPPAIPVRVGLAEERRTQFLGVRLPGFVPSGHAIVSTVVSWGGTVADLVPRI